MIFRVPGVKNFSLKHNIFKDSVLGSLGPRFGSILGNILVAVATILGFILVPGVTQGIGREPSDFFHRPLVSIK